MYSTLLVIVLVKIVLFALARTHARVPSADESEWGLGTKHNPVFPNKAH